MSRALVRTFQSSLIFGDGAAKRAVARPFGPPVYPAHDMGSAREAPITSATQEYLVTLRNLVSSGQPATSAGIARRLGVSPQAASEMIHRLRAEGLVAQRDGRQLTLTRRGRALGDAVFKRHALMEWLLSGVIGLGWAESDHEAHLLQGAISETVEASLDAFLGHPQTCPHGNPMTEAIARQRPPGIPLSTFPSGSEATIYRITEEAEEDAALLSYLDARGLRPGAAVVVKASSDVVDTITVDGPRGSATFGMRPASLIFALPGSADEELFHRLPRPLEPTTSG
jgi:DtxR family transcriptional regulator, Mn-dependent transcriptional regulator